MKRAGRVYWGYSRRPSLKDSSAIESASKEEIQAARDTSRRPLLVVAVFQADLFNTDPVRAKPYYDMIDLLIQMTTGQCTGLWCGFI